MDALRKRRNSGMAVNMAIGPSCFVRCPGCYNHFAGTATKGGLVSRAEVSSFLQLAHAGGLRQVTFSGGDPLTHPEILDILADAKALNLYVKLDTVGTPLLGETETIFYGKRRVSAILPERLYGLVDQIDLPLDGFHGATQELFRKGRPQLNQETCKLIVQLTRLGLNVCVNTVVHRSNLTEIRKVALLLLDLRPNLWQLFEYQPIGPLGSRTGGRFVLRHGEFEALRLSIEKLTRGRLEIDFKSRSLREGMYVMVDDAGTAWLPGVSGPERRILGSIQTDAAYVIANMKTAADGLDQDGDDPTGVQTA